MNVYSNIAVKTNINDFVWIGENENQNRVEYGAGLFTGSSKTPDECGISSVLTEKISEPYSHSSSRKLPSGTITVCLRPITIRRARSFRITTTMCCNGWKTFFPPLMRLRATKCFSRRVYPNYRHGSRKSAASGIALYAKRRTFKKTGNGARKTNGLFQKVLGHFRRKTFPLSLLFINLHFAWTFNDNFIM